MQVTSGLTPPVRGFSFLRRTHDRRPERKPRVLVNIALRQAGGRRQGATTTAAAAGAHAPRTLPDRGASQAGAGALVACSIRLAIMALIPMLSCKTCISKYINTYI